MANVKGGTTTASRNLASPLGLLRLEATAEGLTQVGWPAAEDRLAPADGSPEAAAILAQAVAWLEAYFAGGRAPMPPLAPTGTAFQREVWRRLADVPFGQAVSYGDLARDLGKPGASRAIGQANGANPLPILVPCHRVLAGGGRLGGYSAGLARKEWLLRHERIAWR